MESTYGIIMIVLGTTGVLSWISALIFAGNKNIDVAKVYLIIGVICLTGFGAFSFPYSAAHNAVWIKKINATKHEINANNKYQNELIVAMKANSKNSDKYSLAQANYYASQKKATALNQELRKNENHVYGKYSHRGDNND